MRIKISDKWLIESGDGKKHIGFTLTKFEKQGLKKKKKPKNYGELIPVSVSYYINFSDVIMALANKELIDSDAKTLNEVAEQIYDLNLLIQKHLTIKLED